MKSEQSVEEKNSENILSELVVSSMGYDSISGMYEDSIVAMQNGMCGMTKFDGTVLVPFSHETCQSVDKYDGVTIFAAREEPEFYSFDREGNDLCSIYEGEEQMLAIDRVNYANGLWLRGNYGDSGTYYDNNGNMLISLDYHDAWGNIHTSGYALFWKDYWTEADTTSYIISKDGYQQIDTQGTRPFWTNGKYVWCWDDNNNVCYLFNISTNELSRISSADLADSYGFTGDMLYIIDNDGLYSLLNVDGTFVTEKKYSYIEAANDSKKYYIVREGDSWFYIDCEGNEYATDLKDAGAFYDGQAIVLNQDGQAYIIDENFNQISESVSAEGVLSFNKNAYSIKKEDGKYYPVYLKSAS